MTAPYEAWTAVRYQQAVRRLVHLKVAYMFVLLFGTLIGAAVVYTTTSLWEGSLVLAWIPVVWLISVPMFAVTTFGYFYGFRLKNLLLHVPWWPKEEKTSDVVFLLTTLGTAMATVENSMASVGHWTRRHPELSYLAHRWVVTEEAGVEAHADAFARLRAAGVRVLVVPKDWTTPKGTNKKARALLFASEERKRVFASSDKTWVYHQDDETALGEDAVLGIDEFIHVHANESCVGAGIILYDQNFTWRASQVQELSRTNNDLASLPFLSRQNNPTGNFHGSHYLARADIEDKISWDMGPNNTAEDLYFDILSRDAGAKYYFLRGFAHEQAPLTIRDQLKQRRRWIRGIFDVYQRYEIPAARRVMTSYGMAMWIAASFSLPAMVLGLFFHVAVLASAVLIGFIWVSLVSNYHRAWTLHKEYIDAKWNVGAVGRGMVGAIADSMAPWYAFTTKPKQVFEVIEKDVPTKLSRRPSDGSTPTTNP